MSVNEKEEVKINVYEDLTKHELSVVKRYLTKDRANIGNALNAGLRETMGAKKAEEGSFTSFFFILYILAKFPSNILLKKFKPHVWFSFIITAWSITCMALALGNKPWKFILFRSVLGACESGLTPGVVAYMPYWYTRVEVGFRMSIFFASGTLSGVFGGPIAAGLREIQVGTLPRYATIFVVEGAISVFIGIAAFFIIVDYPDTCKFLNPEEKELITRRLRADQGLASKTKVTARQALNSLMDWKMWAYAVMFFCVNVATVVIATFIPSIMTTLGYTAFAGSMMSSLPNFAGLVGQVSTLYTMSNFPLWLNAVGFGAIAVVGFAVSGFYYAAAISVFIGIAAFFIIVDYPDTCKFLNPEEKELITRRLRADQGLASKTKVTARQALNSLMDWKMWVYAVMFFSVNVATVVIATFIPSIMTTLGYTAFAGSMMSSLPNFAGLIGQISTTYTMTHYPLWLNCVCFGTISLVGFAVAGFVTGASNALVIIFYCIAGLGAFPIIPIVATWMSVNAGGISKRMISSAMTVSFGGIAGAVTGYMFVSNYAPRYRLGQSVNLALCIYIIVAALVLKVYFTKENNRRDNNPEDVSHMSEEEQRLLNDYHPDFRYRL
ncbi:hypothetical protein BB558_001708 [Smittium angustum]|uniref:Major facilitator superfamily (MFS) profile domain-containing protein n=1 Tax=Smittium angustum TaxID=133377 RepID=A0A2U1JAN1_SMIAN|nr:hypothetical protein BB558_001708 [Smittium angustum]